MVRRLLPLLAPVVCGLGAWLDTAYAAHWLHALYGSLFTLLLAVPVLLWGHRSPSDEPTGAEASRRLRSRSFSWARLAWGSLVALAISSLVWTVVSFIGIAVDPEGAVTWSFHVLGALFALVLLTPLIVFLRPAPEEAAAVAAPNASFRASAETGERVQDFIPSSFYDDAPEAQPARAAASAATPPIAPTATVRPDAGSETADSDDLRSIWSYADDEPTPRRPELTNSTTEHPDTDPWSSPSSPPASGTSSNTSPWDTPSPWDEPASPSGRSAPKASAGRDFGPSSGDGFDASSGDGSSSGDGFDWSSGRWPWETDADVAVAAPRQKAAVAARRSVSAPPAAPTASAPASSAPNGPDTDWEMSFWPFDENEDWFADASAAPDAPAAPNAAASDEDEDDTWPPSNWPTFEY